MERILRRIYAKSDKRDEFIIIEYQTLYESRSAGEGFGPTSTQNGAKLLRLPDGREVQATGEPDTYVIVETGEIIRKFA